MVDIHCHLLPGVDDGAKSWEVSEEMCRIAVEDGIQHIVCTPHANDEYVYDRAQHEERLQQLRERVGGRIQLSLGCDFHFSFDNIQEALVAPEKFVISGSDYLLVEFSDFAISPAMNDALLRFLSLGITPVITHPERNLVIQRQPEFALKLAEQGCVIQVTANAITGHWGGNTKKIALWLLERDAVHVIASDAHDPRHRPPILSKAKAAITEMYGAALATALVQDNPRAIISGRPLPYFPQPQDA
ncbi:MAG: CpsB/CapC family capsule biosynthesis tyrosine phosphatase [Terriglobales bacterium]